MPESEQPLDRHPDYLPEPQFYDDDDDDIADPEPAPGDEEATPADAGDAGEPLA